MKARLWTAANVVMLLAFAFSVLLQYNDPDPMGWMLIYGAAAVMCGLELRRLTVTPIAVLVALIALAWAATIAPRVFGTVPFSTMFAEFEMRDAAVEEAREMDGLFLVAAWMIAIAVASARRTKTVSSRRASGSAHGA